MSYEEWLEQFEVDCPSDFDLDNCFSCRKYDKCFEIWKENNSGYVKKLQMLGEI